MTMPGDVGLGSSAPNTSYFGGNLTAYVNNGTIPEARVDDMGMSFPFHKSIAIYLSNLLL